MSPLLWNSFLGQCVRRVGSTLSHSSRPFEYCPYIWRSLIGLLSSAVMECRPLSVILLSPWPTRDPARPQSHVHYSPLFASKRSSVAFEPYCCHPEKLPSFFSVPLRFRQPKPHSPKPFPPMCFSYCSVKAHLNLESSLNRSKACSPCQSWAFYTCECVGGMEMIRYITHLIALWGESRPKFLGICPFVLHGSQL